MCGWLIFGLGVLGFGCVGFCDLDLDLDLDLSYLLHGGLCNAGCCRYGGNGCYACIGVNGSYWLCVCYAPYGNWLTCYGGIWDLFRSWSLPLSLGVGLISN